VIKEKIQFTCNNCGSNFPRWHGKCPACDSWNSISEETITENISPFKTTLNIKASPVPLNSINITEENIIPSSINEFDRVLGKGFIPGEVILLSGEPGIGKSTLALQVAQSFAAQNRTVLYISGEESIKQIYLRSKRLGKTPETLLVYSEVNILEIIKTIEKYKPELVILDSIQVVYYPNLPSTIGSVNQVRQCANELINTIKSLNSVGLIIGHITKDGNLAGPKVLEHLVDAVLYFEGERNQKYRLLRSFKNRFSNTEEIGIFEMSATGLVEISQSSELFIDENTLLSPGSMVVPIMQGSRVILTEVQALVVNSSFQMAKRTFSGLDPARANLMIATLEKKIDVKLYSKDIFLNIIGGLKINEPALDLGLILAIISSLHEKPLSQKIGVVGEVGLTGELRPVPLIEKRLTELEKMGFSECLVPIQNKKNISGRQIKPFYVKNINQAIEFFLNKSKYQKDL
jgi:DNA repair protein RadA/Sms